MTPARQPHPRPNPNMNYSTLERLDIKFSELIGAIVEEQVDGQLSSKDLGDYELVCYCRGFVKAELEKERRATHSSAPAPAPTDEQCRICSDAIRKAEREWARMELLKDLQTFIDNADSRIGCPNGTLGVAYLVQWMGGQGWDCD